MNDTIRVLIADDHPLVRRGIRSLLSTEPGIEVVGEATDGIEAVEGAAQLRPDVILMDLVMPRLDGIEALRQILAGTPECRILVLTSFATHEQVIPAIRAGALGYLLKNSGPDELLRAIRQVHRGEAALHPGVASQILQELAHPVQRPPAPEVLTERETEVLRLVAHGRSNHEIAADLVISVATVRAHVSSILSKLHLGSRTQATLYALREGLATLDGVDR